MTTPSTPVIAAKRLLLVDDDDLLRGVMAREIRKLGYAVQEASTGGEALLFIQAERCGFYDCVVMDYVLDFNMTGGEAVNNIRLECPDQPVLYLSGHDLHDLTTGLLKGESFLQKPAMPKQVVEAVELLLRSRASTIPPSAP
jgi:two-component system cell cycle sensor histidine kinase/response regulator CckA